MPGSKGLWYVAVEPTPAQRKDSVLRREIRGSVLTSCSATHAPKLIVIVEPLNSLSGHFALDSSHSGPFLPDFNRLGVKGSQMESLRTAWIADIRVLGDEAAADLTGETPKA